MDDFKSNRLNKLLAGGKGVESAGTRFQFIFRFLSHSAAWGLGVYVVLVGIWALSVSPMSRSLVDNELEAAWMSSSQSKTWSIDCRAADFKKDECGDPANPVEFVSTQVSLPDGESVLTADQYKRFIDSFFIPTAYPWSPSPIFIFKVWTLISFVAGAGVSIFAFRRYLALGVREGKNKRLAGAGDLVDGPELSKLVEESGSASSWSIADVTLPNQTLVRGVVFCGAQGSGKSTALHDLIEQVKVQNAKNEEEK